MKDDPSTPTTEGLSPNEFEKDKPGTSGQSRAEAAIEELRQRGGIFVEAVRATRMPIALTDPNLPGNPIVFANEAFLNLSGYRLEEVLGQQPHFMNGPGTDPHDAARFAEALGSGQDDIIESIQYRKNGSRFVATVLISAFKDDHGHTLNHFMSWRDVTRRVNAEGEVADLRATQAALQESEDRYRTLFESIDEVGHFATWDWDPRSGKVKWNDRHFLIQGYAVDEVPPSFEAWIGRVHPDDRAEATARIATARAGRTVYEHAYRVLRPDGTVRWVYARGRFFYDEFGEAFRMIGVLEDVTERKEAEAALQASERHAQVLLGELQHRVRNTLAVVRSIARRTSELTDGGADFMSHFEGRLNAFSRVQAVVTRSATGGVELKSLVEDELLALATREGEHLRLEGPNLCLTPRAAESISLAIHELATNAVKYGALTVPDGRIRVSWRYAKDDGADILVFDWRESGLDEAPTMAREGFGHELLLRSLPYDLGATTAIRFEERGLHFAMTLPLTPNVIAAENSLAAQ